MFKIPKQTLTTLVILLTVIGDANAQSEPPKAALSDVLNCSTDVPDHAIKILGNLDYKCSGRIAFLDEGRIVSFENNGASIIDIKSGKAQKVFEIGPRKLLFLKSFRSR